ncbi:MAG: prolipoprotein diacylglyceryl transferase [Clostridia bacterium]|nr:prolipoprotein diacylglyceryl transferase [Clostridia bacterium]
MCPEFTIFGVQVSTYLLSAGVGIAAVCVFNAFRRKKAGLKRWELVLLLALCLTLFLVFSRAFAVLARICERAVTTENFWQKALHGGMVLYGGMFGALTGCALFALIRRRKIRPVMDFFAPSIALSFAFARLGCMLEGCCYGIETGWGIPNAHFPGKLLFPAQPIEVIWNLILFAALLIRAKKRGNDRYSLEICMAGYAVCRFVLDFFKAEHGQGFLPFGLTFSQDISLIVLTFVIVECAAIAIRKARGRRKIE